jgi:hypothetical protein
MFCEFCDARVDLRRRACLECGSDIEREESCGGGYMFDLWNRPSSLDGPWPTEKAVRQPRMQAAG